MFPMNKIGNKNNAIRKINLKGKGNRRIHGRKCSRIEGRIIRGKEKRKRKDTRWSRRNMNAQKWDMETKKN